MLAYKYPEVGVEKYMTWEETDRPIQCIFHVSVRICDDQNTTLAFATS